MIEKLDEFEREIKNAKTLKEYISAYRYRIENTIDASPYGVERTTEKRMLEELERFLPTQLLTKEEFERTYDRLVALIFSVSTQINGMKKAFECLTTDHIPDYIPDKEVFLERQKKTLILDIKKLEAEKEGYRNSILILLTMKEN